MKTTPQRVDALKLLDQAGIWELNAAPPMSRQLWRLGVNVPPPHFISFTTSAVSNGVAFGIIWSLLLYVLHPLFGSTCPAPTLLKAIVGGLFFGLGMATYDACGRSKYELPRWSTLPLDDDR